MESPSYFRLGTREFQLFERFIYVKRDGEMVAELYCIAPGHVNTSKQAAIYWHHKENITPPGKRRYKQNVWGNYVGYVGMFRWVDFSLESDAIDWLNSDSLL